MIPPKELKTWIKQELEYLSTDNKTFLKHFKVLITKF